MRKREWTDEEIKFLESHFKAMTLDDMSVELRCSKNTLRKKLDELGLIKRKPEPEVNGPPIGRLTIREKVMEWTGTQRQTFAICDCACGRRTKQRLAGIKSGRITSCGCWNAEKASQRMTKFNLKHGKASYKNRLYRIWHAMKMRCYSQSATGYANYGGRGIRVCEEWLEDYLKFEEWSLNNGYAKQLTIDRVDVNGHYSPDNCRWADRITQARNRRVTLYLTAFGECKNVSEWLKDPRCSVKSVHTIYVRIHRGWSHESAIADAPGSHEPDITKARNRSNNLHITAFGETKILQEWFEDERCRVNDPDTISWRIKKGWSTEDAISKPIRGRYLTVFGETKAVKDWVKDPRCPINRPGIIHDRLFAGWSDEEAVITPAKRSASKDVEAA